MIRSATGAISEHGSVAQKGGQGTRRKRGRRLEEKMEGRDVRRRVTIQSGWGKIG